MSTTANFATPSEKDSPPRDAASVVWISELLQVFTISIAGVVLGVVATGLSIAPQWTGPLTGLSALVLITATIWLAFKVYSPAGGIVVLMLLVATSTMTAMTSLAPFAILAKLFVLLSVRDKAAKILKAHAGPASSVDACTVPGRASVPQSVVKPRFAWEKWLLGAVIMTLLGIVAYSAYLSILAANR